MQTLESYNTSKDIKLLPVKTADSVLQSADTYFEGIEKLRESLGISREEAIQITRELQEQNLIQVDHASALLKFWKDEDRDETREAYSHTQKLLQSAYTETKPFWKVEGEVLTILQAESEAIFGNELIATNDQPLRGRKRNRSKTTRTHQKLRE